jgi:C4-dicarboxylate transporter, DctM subunit
MFVTILEINSSIYNHRLYIKDEARFYDEFMIVYHDARAALHLPDWQTLLLVNAGLLIAGSFLEPPAAILILTPLLLPVVETAGVNALHFGIIMAVNLSIGLYMPPFGLNLFAARAIFNVPMGMIYRGVLPFIAVNFVALLVITYVPAISMALIGAAR